MDNVKKEIQGAINHEMKDSKSTFSEFEKQKVRNRINTREKSIKNTRYLLPKALTGVAVASFIFIVGGFVGSQTGLFDAPLGEHSNTQADELFPNLMVGDQINGWTLVEKNRFKESKLLTASFRGSSAVTGTIKYTKNQSSAYATFIPDQDSLANLPIDDYSLAPIIAFNSKDQQLVEKTFGLAASADIEGVTLILNQYIVKHKENEVIQDEAAIERILLPKEDEPIQKPFSIQKDSENRMVLQGHLNSIYNEFKSTKTDDLLAELSPSDVFQLWMYAEEIKDYRTQYALFIDDKQYVKTFETVEEYIDAKKEPNSSSLLQSVKEGQLNEVIVNDGTSYISIEEELGLGFGLSKDEKGIWKVNWSPIQ
ncbi:hypothetical protein SM124_07635 [Bacillus sp. 31A1R]|uniref:Anti-sigma factor n=1 Tax=Robertmurraya mangrovi TaxID=3098077 RepID=A0ABU5IWR9_9BACI|nr:hypothetical protein [Bacillus sp. 31A1R]MDZ5471618.1 hypothetical protein [Bacillus sp. 31A1R]